ncbi:winged helix-turn-helix domain-containing protein [Hoeflea sp.]|uniref:winged helix-turn-helix domain-containing protein n=1 Tax=Hoeflea sp. TaxID=1940281 RepID=UPI003B01292B
MIYAFATFEVDTAKFELRKSGRTISVEPQVFAVIRLLIENRDRMVSKTELVDAVWDGRAVSESAISSRIRSARNAIEDDGKAQRVIQTVHGRGFRFLASVEELPT